MDDKAQHVQSARSARTPKFFNDFNTAGKVRCLPKKEARTVVMSLNYQEKMPVRALRALCSARALLFLQENNHLASRVRARAFPTEKAAAPRALALGAPPLSTGVRHAFG